MRKKYTHALLFHLSFFVWFKFSYVGGEARVQGARTTDIAIAFPVAASDYLAAQVASTILGSGSLTRSNLKCGHGTAGRLNKVCTAVSTRTRGWVGVRGAVFVGGLTQSLTG